MDGSLMHWLWTLGAFGVWLLAVWSVYFFFLRKHIEDIKTLPKDSINFFETRHQRDEKFYLKNRKRP
jgi:hypothetical protein